MSSKAKTVSMKSFAQLADSDSDEYNIEDENKIYKDKPLQISIQKAGTDTTISNLTGEAKSNPIPKVIESSADTSLVKDANSREHQKSPHPQVKSEVVEHHPLNRSSSNSSSSSLELDAGLEGSPQYRYRKPILSKVRGSSVGRIRDIMPRVEDTDGGSEPTATGYYSTASAMWLNRGKILSNLKKQASDGVRSLTQSTSLDTGHNQGLLATSTEPEVTKPPPRPPPPNFTKSSEGLIKIEAENLEEVKADTEVSSFLHGFKEKVSDPLQILLNKKKEEDELRKELEEMHFETASKRATRHRSFTSSSAIDSDQSPKVEFYRQSDSPSLQRKATENSSYKQSFAVSLSSLLGRRHSLDEASSLSKELQEVDTMTASEESDPNLLESYSINNNNVTKQSFMVEDENEIIKAVEPPPVLVLLTIWCIVYFYLMFPIPATIVTIVRSFMAGCIMTSSALCVFAPASKRTRPFLPLFINRSQPYAIPKTLYDPNLPLKGWMNEAFFYDPQTYHISNTQAAFITLDGNTLRIQTPQKNISRRSTYKEGNIPISNVIHQRLFDITFAKVYLKPEGLVKKRVWSKKYPICVEIPVKDQNKMKSKTTSLETDEQAKDTMNENVDVKDMECLYLFGRTDRQKEEWFYRIQRAINVALARHKVNKTEPNQKEGNENEPLLNIEDEWGIIEENHYEEEMFLSSSLRSVDTINSDPLRAYKDYYLHISRLMPDDKPKWQNTQRKGEYPTKIESVDVGIQEPGLDVAWINALLGRITFDFLRQPSWAKWLSIKIQKKLDKIKLPYFMDELKLTEMNLGSTVPLVHQISLPRLDAQGLWLEMEVTYIGTVQMTLKTKLVLTKLGKQEPVLKVDKNSLSGSSAITDSDAEDSAESSDDEDESTVSRIVGQVQTAVSKFDGPQILKGNPNPLTPPTAGAAPPKKWVRIVDSIAKSKYFQRATESEFIRKKLETVSNTPMMLSVELLQLRGVLAINIPPPPTDRIWYGFREPPNMVIKAHPQVGERLVRTSHVTDWIENKLQQEFVKVLVMPNMDDIPIPVMFNNRTSS
nr:testis-expressed protein 2-like isoform X1 [Ciona intestinalis]|eukprot:XP_026689539.1 testis-expressed protein 2-like isoform X1 [Ciona intestinalis]